MASGALLADWNVQDIIDDGSAFGAFSTINGQGCAEIPDDSGLFVMGLLPSTYSGGGLSLTLIWASETDTSGNCRLACDVERMPVGYPFASNSWGPSQSVLVPCPSTVHTLAYSTILFTPGAQMDDLVAGERFRLYIWHDVYQSDDTMLDTVWLFALRLTET